MKSGRSVFLSGLSVFALSTAAIFIVAPASVLAQTAASGSVSGVVRDASGSQAIAGATVTLSPLGLRVPTASDGTFRFNNVPAGSYEVTIAYFSGTAATSAVSVTSGVNTELNLSLSAASRAVDTVIVRGQRGSLASARSQERVADQIKTIVSADAIGNFADPNVAESLQRLPGLSIRRSEGEGQQVAVRGLSGSFVTVTVDGAKLGTRDLGSRSVNLDVISADLLNGIEVTKSLTPDLDADAVAGNVNLRTASAFSARGDTIGFKAEASYEEKAEAFNPDFSMNFARRLGEHWGLAGGMSWSKRDSVVDEFSVDDGLRILPVFPATTPATSVLSPLRFNLRNDPASRTRFSTNLNLEFRPTADHEFFLRGSYATFEDDDLRARTRIEFDDAVTTRILGATATSFRGNRIDVEKRFRFTDQKDTLYNVSTGGESVFGAWTIDYQVDYSTNESDQPSVEPRFRERDAIASFSNLSIDGADFSLESDPARNSNPNIASTYDLRFITALDYFVEDTISAAKIDVQRDVELFGRQAYFKFGAKINDRTKSVDEDRADVSTATPSTMAAFITGVPKRTNLNVGLFPDLGALRGFALAEVSSGLAAGRVSPTLLDSSRNDFTADERVIAGYAMSKFNIADNLQIIAGVRVEATEWESLGNQNEIVTYDTTITSALNTAMTRAITARTATFTAAERDAYLAPRRNALGVAIEEVGRVTPFAGSKQYTDWFPSVHVRWDISDALIGRASFSTATKRPDFDEATAVRVLRTQELAQTTLPTTITSIAQANSLLQYRRTIQLRDPNLEPLIANQFDLALGWYPDRNTSVQVSAFYKALSNFVVTTAFSGSDVTRLGFTQGNGTINGGIDIVETFINGDDATVYGVEVAYTQNFVFLPGPLKGLFLNANLTVSDSEATAGLVGRAFTLPDQADMVGNLTLGWENEAFEARVSANYTGERLVELNGGFLGIANADSDILERERLSVDINLRMNLFDDRLQLFADATNLTDAGERQYFRASSQGGIFFLDENYGRSFQIGMRVKY